MYYIDDYCDENFIINNTYVSSPETSIIFSKITEEKRQEFFKEWIKVKKDNECIAYDITSISSYSKEITLLDYGYNNIVETYMSIQLQLVIPIIMSSFEYDDENKKVYLFEFRKCYEI